MACGGMSPIGCVEWIELLELYTAGFIDRSSSMVACLSCSCDVRDDCLFASFNRLGIVDHLFLTFRSGLYSSLNEFVPPLIIDILCCGLSSWLKSLLNSSTFGDRRAGDIGRGDATSTFAYRCWVLSLADLAPQIVSGARCEIGREKFGRLFSFCPLEDAILPFDRSRV